MSRRDELTGRMGSAINRQPAEPGEGKPARAPRTERVRHTLDLEPATWRALKRYALDHDAHLADVFRVLGDLVLEDEQLAERVAGRLYRQQR